MLSIQRVVVFIMFCLAIQRGAVAYPLVAVSGRASRTSTRLFASTVAVEQCLSRVGTLQSLLRSHGAPGSIGCSEPNDLDPILRPVQDVPELFSALGAADSGVTASGADLDLTNVHPFLYPIAVSQSTGNLICAYRNPATEESNRLFPWPIVETTVGGPGFRLLALNSEHMMRRIACESDVENEIVVENEVVAAYNKGLGEGNLADPACDFFYEPGSVAKLGYGVDKYVLLRVGPFPDLYQKMAEQHKGRGDEQSSLIAAEACNTKLAGFGSTFLYYAELLSTFPSRREEARDAARMCLRLPIPTVGLSDDELYRVAILSEAADPTDSVEVALRKLEEFYHKMRQVEMDEDPIAQQDEGKTPQQVAFEEINVILDRAVFSRTPWSSVREHIGEKLRSVDRDDFARFVDFSS